MKCGVHCSVRKGFSGALIDAKKLGCDTLQIFSQSPRGWKTRVIKKEEFVEFRKKRAELQLGPVVIHTPYLPNLCTTDSDLYQKSIQSLKDDLGRCEGLGAEYLVIHPGAYSPDSSPEVGIENLILGCNEALDMVPGRSMILIEIMAGGGRRLGSTFQELKAMLKGIKPASRVGICFDTCHAMAAGYDLSHSEGIKKTLKEFDDVVGLEHIKVFHVNDSKGPCGNHLDRHEHLGKGSIGMKGFKELLSQPQFKGCTFILETPKEPEPEADLRNLERLRASL
jgi:deoxyribonuclease-4